MPDLRILYLALILLAISNPYISDYLTTTEHCYYQITTLSPSHPSANCFTVSRSGLFKRVYTSKRQSGSSTGYVLPGLWDGHGHLLQYGEFLSSVDLFHTDSLGDVRGRLASFAERFPDAGGRDSWIRGSGWDQAAFGGVMPTSVCFGPCTAWVIEMFCC